MDQLDRRLSDYLWLYVCHSATSAAMVQTMHHQRGDANRTTPTPANCTCQPAWPQLVVHTDDDRLVDVVPADTPGGLACLYRARCGDCDATYPGAFRVPPRRAPRDVSRIDTAG